MVVLNLQPSSSLDYANTDTGEWLANCSACCVPEISNAFKRAAIPFNVVSGTLHDEHAWAEIEEWCHAAAAVGTLHRSRFGFLGHTYPGMLDMYSDFTMHQAQLGLHVDKTREYLANDETNRRWSEWMDPIMKVDVDPATRFPYLLPLQWHMD